MAEIKLTGIDKVYPGGTHAVHSVDLHIADGEFMIMVGPSGCAKSTILRMIAGLETPTGGTLEIGGRVVNDAAPKDRDIAMVFQSYALYPHMTVRENMAFGLRLRKMPDNEINARVMEAATILGLEHLLDRLPKAMSGGQRQRVAMGRAIVREPQAFLMDEPLSNLDAKLRVQMRTEIAKLHQRLGTTTVYVTHDQVEALTLGQRICILRKGVVQQVNTPYEVYQNPTNIFVGSFIGSPGMNFMSGQLAVHGNQMYVQIGDHFLELPESVTSRFTGGDANGRPVVFGIRPEHLEFGVEGEPGTVPATVALVESMGAEQYVYLSHDVVTPDLTELSDTQGTSSTFTARLSSAVQVSSGSNVLMRPQMDEIHLFDPHTMLTLLAPAHEAEVLERRCPTDAGPRIKAAAPRQMRAPQAPAPTMVPAPAPIEVATSPLRPAAMTHYGAPAQMPRPTFGGDVPGMAPPATVPGMLPDANPQRVASIFEQSAPAAAPAEQLPPAAHVAAPSAPEPPARRGFAARPIRPSARLDGAADAQLAMAAPTAAPPAPAVASTDAPAASASVSAGDEHVGEVFDAVANAAPQMPRPDQTSMVPLTSLRTRTAVGAGSPPASAFRAALARMQPQQAPMSGLPAFQLRGNDGL